MSSASLSLYQPINIHINSKIIGAKSVNLQFSSSQLLYKSPNRKRFRNVSSGGQLAIGSSVELCTVVGCRVRTRVSSNDKSFDLAPSKDEAQSPDFVEFITSERVKVVAMLALALALCNTDRVVMSVAIVPLSLAHGWSRSFSSIVQSSFLWGYLVSPIAGGTLVDYYGGKVVMAWGVALWSLATFLTPWAADTSLWTLLAMRAMVGLAEGVALPAMNNMIARTSQGCCNCNGWIYIWKCNRTGAILNSHVTSWYFWAVCNFWIIWISMGFGLVVCYIMYS